MVFLSNRSHHTQAVAHWTHQHQEEGIPLCLTTIPADSYVWVVILLFQINFILSKIKELKKNYEFVIFLRQSGVDERSVSFGVPFFGLVSQ